MQEWFVPILTGVNLVLFILNSIWARKVRRQDQMEKLEDKMTEKLDKLGEKIVELGREVSEIKGRIEATIGNRR